MAIESGPLFDDGGYQPDYVEPTPYENTDRMAELEAARLAAYEETAKARAATDPMLDITQRPAAEQTNPNYIYYYSWIGGTTNGQWTLYRAPNTVENQLKYGSRTFGGTTQASYTSSLGANALVNQPNPTMDANGNVIGWNTPTDVTDTESTTKTNTKFNFSFNNTNTTDNKTTTTDSDMTAAYMALQEKQRTETAISTLTDLFTKYGLSSLIPKMKELAIAGATEATISLELSSTPEWKERFKANEIRRKNNLAVLEPGEYIALEDKYRQILRAYGLKRFDSDDYVSKFIAGDMSPSELQSRVSIAIDRVQNADPLVTDTLRRFYNITTTDLAAYLLNPEDELPKLERQVTAAEVGAKFGEQGLLSSLNAGQTGTGFSNVSRQTLGVDAMVKAGATAETAARAAQYISGVLPRAEFLSSLYGNAYEQYGQLEAEQESVLGLASAARARQRLSARERSQFGGSSGISRASFGSQSQGNF